MCVNDEETGVKDFEGNVKETMKDGLRREKINRVGRLTGVGNGSRKKNIVGCQNLGGCCLCRGEKCMTRV